MKVDNIAIRSYETRKKPDTHVVYVIEVSTKSRVWTVYRRYSDFVDLNELLSQKYGVRQALPPKKAFGNMSPQVLDTRRQGLEEYLKALVLGKDERVSNSAELSRFLETDAEASKPVNMEASPENWLEQYRALENLSNAITVHLTNRDRLVQRGEGDGMEDALAARKKLTQLTTKLAELGSALKVAEADSTSNVSEKELIRRHDLLDKLRGEKDQLDTWLKKPRNNDQNSRELMGGASSSASGGQRPRRVFGAEETEETRMLDNQGVMQLQKKQVEVQDQALDQLMGILSKQKQIASAIGNELDDQLNLLEDLDTAVDRTKDKVRRAGKKMTTIS